jgi:hypothetical protein
VKKPIMSHVKKCEQVLMELVFLGIGIQHSQQNDLYSEYVINHAILFVFLSSSCPCFK